MVGRLFGPVMVVWFVVLAVTGLPHDRRASRHPARPVADLRRRRSSPIIRTSRSSRWARWCWRSPAPRRCTPTWATSAGRRSAGVVRARVPRADAQLPRPGRADPRHSPTSISNPFYPAGAELGADPDGRARDASATVIASQAVISGAFSVSRQAVRLGFLPHLTVRHTSTRESGQIYVPAVNWLLFGGVLVADARRSARPNKLATAYGLAVTGTLLLTTTLFLIVAATRRGTGRGGGSSLVGGRLRRRRAHLLRRQPHQGRARRLAAAGDRRRRRHGDDDVAARPADRHRAPHRRSRGRWRTSSRSCDDRPDAGCPGTAVFPHPTKETTPLALRANVEFNHVLHEHVVIVSVRVGERAARADRASGSRSTSSATPTTASCTSTMRFGFQDEQDIPEMLARRARAERRTRHRPGRRVVLPVADLRSRRATTTRCRAWRKRLFIGLAHNAATPAAYFCLPDDRTVVMGSHVDL